MTWTLLGVAIAIIIIGIAYLALLAAMRVLYPILDRISRWWTLRKFTKYRDHDCKHRDKEQS